MSSHAASRLGDLEAPTALQVRRFIDQRVATRLAARDASLWSQDPAVTASIQQRLGWVDLPFASLPPGVVESPSRVALLGMGGSSLGARALAKAWGCEEALRVLDSTVPAAVRRFAAGDVLPTDVIVASKSGSTIETDALARYFEEHWGGQVRFHAITDAGTELAHRAEEAYAGCHLNPADIGGRFSVLSAFGMVPAAMAGIATERLLHSAADMARRCRVDDESNPGIRLGAVLAAAVAAGRDKLSLIAAPGLRGLADWVEQLVAESTGKAGTGIVPITGEGSLALTVRSEHRIVVVLEWGGDAELPLTPDLPSDVPVIRLRVDGPAALGGEFYRWQVGVAVAAVALGINPFDEPDVASAKRRTAEMLAGFEVSGQLEVPADVQTAGELRWAGPVAPDVLMRTAAQTDGGYLGLLAFLDESDEARAGLAALRRELSAQVPVAAVWGPRYLHSSGQLYKGGPPRGSFLVVTTQDAERVPIPGRDWDFQTLAMAQALGDAAALAQRGRPVVHVHLTGAAGTGLAELSRLVRP